MKFSTTAVFLGLFVLVAVFFVYLDPLRKEPEPAAPEQAVMRLLPVDGGGEIRLIEIRDMKKKETVVLERGPDGWKLTSPVEYPAQTPMVEGLVTALRLSLKARRLLPEKDWDEYGLAKPSIAVGIEREGGRERRYLEFGNFSQVSKHVFARWRGEPEYFLLDAQMKGIFEQTAYSLRQKKIFRNSVQDSHKIRLEVPQDTTYEMAKKDGRWVWTEPVDLLGEEVDPEDASAVLNQLERLHVKDFLDDCAAKPAEYGFYIFGTTVKSWSGADARPEVLHLGSEVPAKDAYYGTREDEPVCFFVARTNVQSLFETLRGLNEKYSSPQEAAPSQATPAGP